MDQPASDFLRFPGAPADAAARRAAELGASRLEARARIRFAVARALAQGRLVFHYQPVVRAENTGFVAFHEMLARLRLPDGNVLAAGAFLPLVGDEELGREIDRLALGQALTALGADPRLRLSINVSPRTMGDPEWLALLAGETRRSVTGRLILELTEDSAIEDVGQTRDFAAHVQGFGCALALDDFGAGATGFRHFRELRFDLVKLDGDFARGVHAARDAQVLVECLGAVARHFDMLVVAERVEDPADAAWLRGRGIDCFQGYLFGRPAERPEFPSLPAARRAAG
ncbi:EAL domain-containing protein [Amaricoccus solimangrovi]|uniref:EAL domain-containing protein n=1 Tax=Amaricoccus solimangrovi TaxID=2589815 RepID=A0A501WMW1_9RHOB|nr:EAL domain-containing protein [Amaricoccus solimangrovi]TPE48311.1 EAL domain-containing protein [Amaricoccus solimangrovi]